MTSLPPAHDEHQNPTQPNVTNDHKHNETRAAPPVHPSSFRLPPSDCGWHPSSNDEAPIQVAPAPLDVLPAPVANLASEIALAVGCDPGFALGPILAVVGGLIGGSFRLQIGPRWFASAGILQASVGWPGAPQRGAARRQSAEARRKARVRPVGDWPAL